MIRRTIASSVASLALVLLIAAPALAVSVTAVTVECFTDQQGQVFVAGNISVTGAQAGDQITLQLEGRIGNSGYNPIAGFSDTVTLSAGQTSADYSINITNLDPSYTNFRVASSGSTSNERSRSFDRDECSVVIPEAPVTGLLALTGGLVAIAFVFYRSRRRTLPIGA
jgi:uncharacterized protein (DUF2141 family)